jgi:Protein of unknown function (DUF402)
VVVGGQQVEEVKVHLDGRRQSFTCELVALDRRGAIIAWRNPSTLEFPLFNFPAGSLSHGFFWRRRQHNLYRFSGAAGELLGYRLDLITQPEISGERVVYTDRLLDIVQKVGLPPVLEDIDELDAAMTQGLVSAAEANAATAYAQRLLKRLPRVLAEAERWLRESL